MFPIIPPIVQRLWVDGSGPKRKPCGAAAACNADCTTPGSTRAVCASGSISRILFRCRDVSKINPGPTALPAQDVPAPRVVTGMPTVRAASRTAAVSSTVRGWATACGTNAIERGVGRVERAGEVGCVENVSDTAAPQL